MQMQMQMQGPSSINDNHVIEGVDGMVCPTFGYVI
jgi:hypothetical protein